MKSIASIHGRWPGLLWNTASLESRDSWRRSLPGEVADEFVEFVVPDREVTPTNFEWDPERLPLMAALGSEVRDQLLSGDGLCWLRSIDALELTAQHQQCLFSALGCAIGEPMRQPDRLQTVPSNNAAASLHTDGSSVDVVPDFVGLLCGQTGNRSVIQVSNALQLYHFMRINLPDVLDLLEEPWIRDLVPPELEENRSTLLQNRFPVYNRCERPGGIVFRYLRYGIEAGQEKSGSPLNATALRAFNVLDELLAAPEQVVHCALETGGMMWINNRTVAHSLASGEEEGEPGMLRRMWVKTGAEPIPDTDKPG